MKDPSTKSELDYSLCHLTSNKQDDASLKNRQEQFVNSEIQVFKEFNLAKKVVTGFS